MPYHSTLLNDIYCEISPGLGLPYERYGMTN